MASTPKYFSKLNLSSTPKENAQSAKREVLEPCVSNRLLELSINEESQRISNYEEKDFDPERTFIKVLQKLKPTKPATKTVHKVKEKPQYEDVFVCPTEPTSQEFKKVVKKQKKVAKIDLRQELLKQSIKDIMKIKETRQLRASTETAREKKLPVSRKMEVSTKNVISASARKRQESYVFHSEINLYESTEVDKKVENKVNLVKMRFKSAGYATKKQRNYAKFVVLRK